MKRGDWLETGWGLVEDWNTERVACSVETDVQQCSKVDVASNGSNMWPLLKEQMYELEVGQPAPLEHRKKWQGLNSRSPLTPQVLKQSSKPRIPMQQLKQLMQIPE